MNPLLYIMEYGQIEGMQKTIIYFGCFFLLQFPWGKKQSIQYN